MRVLLEKGAKHRIVEGQGETLLGRAGRAAQWQRLPSPSQVGISAEGISVGGKPAGDDPLYLRGGVNAEAALQVDGRRFPGALRFSRDGKEMLVTNVVPLETYLSGTVGAEMPGKWPLEALKAQAVASRSYALYMNRHPRDPRYDLERTVIDQVYDGSAKFPKVKKAVEETRGEVLLHDGEIVKAYYHSRCGGQTDVPENVWGKRERGPYGVARCDFCAKHPFGWRTFVPAEEVAKALSLETSVLAQLEPLGFFSSGRQRGFRLPGTSVWSGETLRRLLGYSRLKSTRFSLESSPVGWFVSGTGAGHGVGMCQWGARALALAGKSHRQILAHFYPGSTVGTVAEVVQRPPSLPRMRTARREAVPVGEIRESLPLR